MFLYHLIVMDLDPTVWGPYYWFVLFSIAISYPTNPNDVIKKKYYDFFHNLPLFIPHIENGDNFSKLLDKYPITPYLDSRDSLMKWVNFIHNRINLQLGKNELSLSEAVEEYYKHYLPQDLKRESERKRNEKIIYGSIITTLTICCFYLYKNRD